MFGQVNVISVAVYLIMHIGRILEFDWFGIAVISTLQACQGLLGTREIRKI